MCENSKIISGFLDWLRNIPELYDANLSDQKQQEDLTQDLLHHLELDNPDYRETARRPAEFLCRMRPGDPEKGKEAQIGLFEADGGV